MATFDYTKYQDALKKGEKKVHPSFYVLKDYLDNPDKYVFPFVIKEKNKERTIITYNKGSDYGKKLRSAHELLLQRFQVNFSQRNEHSYAYHKGVRCLDALDDHLTSHHFIKLDIHHFFESITASNFFKVYDDYFNDKWKEDLKGCFYKGALSIGFVTSPEISDFYMRSFDRNMERYLLEHQELHYSRYSDDMLLSSSDENNESLETFFNFVKDELSKLGLEINDKKTRRVTLSYKEHNSISFLGLNLSKENDIDNKVTISKRYILFLLKLIEKNNKWKSSCRELVNEINSRVAYLAYNSPISYERFQKKYRNIYGVSYNFIPKKPFERTAPLNASNIPNFEEDSKLFKIDLHKKVKGKDKKDFGVNDAIELVSYLGKDQKVVVIPPYINSIGERAFNYHSEIEEIVLNDKLKNIDGTAFFQCRGLKKITLPNSLRFIGQQAFSGCSSLKEIIIPNKVNIIHSHTFSDSGLEKVTFGTKVREISNGAFTNCHSLKEINFNEELVLVGPSAFRNCTALKEVDLSKTKVEKNDDSCFMGDISLTAIKFPETLLSLENSAFEGCSNLEEIHIPELLVNISNRVFSKCYNLRKITIDENNRVYHHSKNHDAIIETNRQKLVFALPTYKIQDDILVIGKEAFTGSYLKEIVLPKNLVSIEEGAFLYARWLQKIVIPESVKEIGPNVFAGCTSLKEVKLPSLIQNIPDGLFKNCVNLHLISPLDNVTSIGKEAFSNCESLDINLPNGVKSIDYKAFEDCHKIKHLSIPKDTNKINENAFYGMAKCLESISVDPLNTTYTSLNDNVLIERKDGKLILGCKSSRISKDVNVIGNYAFAYCDELKEIDLPYTVKEIGKGAFLNCTKLEKVNFNKVYKIFDYAFMNCESLEEINLPDTLVHLGNHAFSNVLVKEINIPKSVVKYGKDIFSHNEYLEKVYLPSTMHEFEQSMFRCCPNIKSIVIDPTNPAYDSRNNCNGVIRTKDNRFILGCQNTVLPEDIKGIESHAFNNVNGLKSISIPASVEYMGEKIFMNCRDLEEVTFYAAGVSSNMFRNCTKLKTVNFKNDKDMQILENAFRNCSALESITLPENLVGPIKTSTFAYCESLKKITLPSKVEGLSIGAFLGCKSLESITLNEGLKFILGYVFKGCSKLTSVTLPKSLTLINGSNVFEGTAIKEINIPENVTSLGSMIFKGMDLEKITVHPDNKCFKDEGCNIITYKGEDGTKHLLLACKNSKLVDDINIIDPYAFASINELTSIELNDNIYSISDNAFENCANLKEVKFPHYLAMIDTCAFKGCKSLEKVEICKNITKETKPLYIRYDAFTGCTNLKSISIKGEEISVDSKAFSNCPSIEYIDIDAKGLKVGDNHDTVLSDGNLILASSSSLIPHETKIICHGLYLNSHYDRVDIPEGVTFIQGAFNGCTIKEVILPASLRKIDNSFSHTKVGKFKVHKDNPSYRTNESGNMLYEVTTNTLIYSGDDGIIPEGTTSLAAQAINREDVKHIYIPSTLFFINNVFEACRNAVSIECHPDNPLFYAKNNCLLRKSDHSLVMACLSSIIPSETKAIRACAFMYVKDIDTIHIHKDVTYIASDAFPSDNHYQRIIVDKDNLIFDSRNDSNAIILTKDNYPILTCPNSKLPDDVKLFTYLRKSNSPMRPFLSRPTVIDDDGDFSFWDEDLPF